MPPTAGWLEDFVPFTAFHLLSAGICAALILGACASGRCLRCGSPHERRFRLAWGCFGLALMVVRNALYLQPSRFDIESSLPLHLCDLGILVAALAMITPNRVWRSLLYFWGIGLSVQAFITPTLQFGAGWPQYWFFWAGHTVIVGSAIYDLVVGRYRPTGRDFALVTAVTLAYAMTIFFLDMALKVNYGFLGATTPKNRTVIDSLGPWPGRVFIILGAVLLEFLVLWLIWPLALRLRGRPTPNTGTT